jgi:hypothetical protein
LIWSSNASPLYIIAESSTVRAQTLVDFNPEAEIMLATLVKNWRLETLNRHFWAIKKLKFYSLPQSTHSLGSLNYRNKLVNSVEGNHSSSLCESDGTHKYILWAKCSLINFVARGA